MEAKFTRGPYQRKGRHVETAAWSANVHPFCKAVDTAELEAVATLFQASPLLYEALEALEWQQVGIEEWECPICHADHDEGHFPDCKLGNALRAARGEK